MPAWRTVAAATLLLTAPAAGGVQAPRTPIILVLMSGDGGNPSGSEFVRGAREALPAPCPDDGVLPILYTEYLDLNRFGSPEDRAHAVASLSDKYATRRPDVILAYLDPAANIALELRRVFDADVPIVFVGNEDRWMDPAQRPRRATGAVLDARPNGMLAFVRQVVPGTREVAVITGATPIERRWQQVIEADWRTSGHPERLVPLAGLPIEALLERVKQLPPGAVVVSVSFLMDANGRSYEPRTALALISEASRAPVFVATEIEIGSGAVGGFVFSPSAAGRHAMGAALRVLAGEPVDAMPVVRARDVATRRVVDARALRRWGIPESRLPQGTAVLFPQASLWRDYRAAVLVTVAAVTLLLGMVAALLTERKRRMRVECEAREQLLQLAFLDRRAALGELSASIAHDINQPLAAILNNAEAAALVLQRESPPLDQLREIIDDIRRDDQRAGDIVHRVRSLLQRGELERQHVDMRRLALDTLALLRRDAVAQGTELIVQQPDDVPQIEGDPTHLRQLLLNVCLNAMHAVREVPGPRRVVVRITRGETGVVVRVTDTGPGFSPDEIMRAFEPFYTTKSRDGMGMGLAIARRIVDAHGGSILAETLAPPGGAAITIVLPATPSA